MGFFKDFKRDFAQAVNELMPDKNELAGEYDDEDMVNTFDEGDNMDIAPEDMFEDLDDFSIDDRKNYETFKPDAEPSAYEEDEEDVYEEEDKLSDIPEAEVINEPADMEVNTFDNEENIPSELMTEVNTEDTVFDPDAMAETLTSDEKESAEDGAEQDELIAADELDEGDMEENMEAAIATEPTEAEDSANAALQSMNLAKDVSDALIKREELEEEQASEEMHRANDDWEDSMAEIEKIKEEEGMGAESNIEGILSDDTTYITKGTVIKGNIETEGGIDIIGTVNGDVNCGGKLILGGSIVGNVKAGEIYANAAKIEGEVSSEGSVKIGVGSVVVGNISATSAVIAGAVNGDIDVHGPVIVDSTAVIMGNIKSRSVQINNGAVIEGFCSQCYSEIDVKSFFE